MIALRYWKPLAAALLLALAYYWGWATGRDRAYLACERSRNEVAEAGRREADALNKKLQEALSKPQAPKIKEAIRANPSHCDVPKPVADGLREAIRAANASE